MITSFVNLGFWRLLEYLNYDSPAEKERYTLEDNEKIMQEHFPRNYQLVWLPIKPYHYPIMDIKFLDINRIQVT